MTIWDVNVDTIVISKLIETKSDKKKDYFLIISKMSGYVKAFKVKNEDRDQYNYKLEKYKAIWTKIEVLKNIGLNPLPVYDDR